MGSASLAAHLAQEIAAGRWVEGESLPGVRRLAQEVGCAPGTAARAYTALRDLGVLAGSPRSRAGDLERQERPIGHLRRLRQRSRQRCPRRERELEVGRRRRARPRRV